MFRAVPRRLLAPLPPLRAAAARCVPLPAAPAAFPWRELSTEAAPGPERPRGFWAGATADFRAEVAELRSKPVWSWPKALMVKYGLLGFVSYEVMFWGGFGGAYLLCDSFGNFGMDINPLVESLGMREPMLRTLQFVGFETPASPSDPLSPRTTSAAMALVITELSDVIRLPILIFFLPTLRRAIGGGSSAASAGDSSATSAGDTTPRSPP